MWWVLACPITPEPADSGDSAPTPSDTAPEEEPAPPPTGAWATLDGAPADGLGNALDASGDLNGDGADDLLVAAYLGNRVCAVFAPFPAAQTPLDSQPAACFVGEVDSDYAGYGIAAPGELTGDGAADLVVGSIGNSDAGTNAGRAYLLAGPFTAGSASLGTSAYASWTGETAGDYAGIHLAAAGDLTGDGTVDLLVGASGYDGEGGGGGRAYLVAGPFERGAHLLGNAYATVTGLGPPAGAPPPPHGAFGTGDFVGDSQAGAFDFNGDGQADLALGASGNQTFAANAGKVAVFFGPIAPGGWSIEDADGSLFGEAEHSFSGSPLRGVPDLTGEGLDDLLVSADNLGPGVVYLTSPALGETALSGSVSRFEGEADGDLFGYALSRAGDLDGDGALDVVISAPGSGRTGWETGAVWWFAGPFMPGILPVAEAAAVDGAEEGESFGSSLDLVGDLTADGLPELAVGARTNDANGGFAGRVYLFSL